MLFTDRIMHSTLLHVLNLSKYEPVSFGVRGVYHGSVSFFLFSFICSFPLTGANIGCHQSGCAVRLRLFVHFRG